MSKPITSFRGKYDFLSNFYPSPVEFEGVDYPTVEHAYQAAKTPDPDHRQRIRAAKTPKSAKSMGGRIKHPAGWRGYNLQLMQDLILQKFTRYDDLRQRLLATGDAELIEGNTWDDRFFGMVRDKETGEWVGENHLGQMLMRVRDQLRQQATDVDTISRARQISND